MNLDNHCRPTPPQTVVDIGAGAGWSTIRLARSVGPNGNVYTQDGQRQVLEAIRRALQSTSDGRSFQFFCVRHSTAESITSAVSLLLPPLQANGSNGLLL